MKRISLILCLIGVVAAGVVWFIYYPKTLLSKVHAIQVSYDCFDDYETRHSEQLHVDSGTIHELSALSVDLQADNSWVYYCDLKKKLPSLMESDITEMPYMWFKANWFIYYISQLSSKWLRGYTITKTNQYDTDSFECGKNELEYAHGERNYGRIEQWYIYCKDKYRVYLLNYSWSFYWYKHQSLIELPDLLPSKLTFSGDRVRYDGWRVMYGAPIPWDIKRYMILANDCIQYPTTGMSEYRFCTEDDVRMYVNSADTFVDYRSSCDGSCDWWPLYDGHWVKFSKKKYEGLLYP